MPFPLRFICTIIFTLSAHIYGEKVLEYPSALSVGQDIEVSVIRGGGCELLVSGVAMPMDKVEFQVLKKPIHGTLVSHRRIDNQMVSYLYTHNGKAGTVQDRVDFKIKTGQHNPWGRVVAKIWVKEPPAALIVEPSELDFGSILTGDSKSLVVKIWNAGGGIVKGRAATQSPWLISGDEDFELTEGIPKELNIQFSPEIANAQIGQLDFLYGSGKRTSVTLKGEGKRRFDAPKRVSFPAAFTKGVFLVPIYNKSSKPISLQISADPPLRCSARLNLPPSESESISVGLEQGYYSEKQGRIVVSDKFSDQIVLVDLPPTPALLEWLGGQEVDLGSIPFRYSKEFEAGLENKGSTQAIVHLEDGVGGLCLAPSQSRSFNLDAGQLMRVKLIWKLSEQIGEVRSKLTALEGGEAHEIAFKIRVNSPTPPPPKVSELKDQNESIVAPSYQNTPQILSKTESVELKQRMPQDVFYRLKAGFGSATAIVNWKYSASQQSIFSIERLVADRINIDLDGSSKKRQEVPRHLPKRPVVGKWVQIDPAIADISLMPDGRWQANVPGLSSGFHQLRIASRSPSNDKRTDYVEFTIHIGRLPGRPWLRPALGLLGGLSFLYLLRRRIVRWLGFLSKHMHGINAA